MIKTGGPERPGVSQPFVLFGGAVRGRLIRLNDVADVALGRHAYPDVVNRILGETMAAAAALADTLKFDGSFTLQIQGDGPVHTLVADITSDRAMRGCAKFHEEDVARAVQVDETSLPHLLGQGHIAFTVDQGADTDRYQGIIELIGANISDCIHQYFRQSEQLETAIKVAAHKTSIEGCADRWQASAIMVQRMPLDGAQTPTEEDDDAWRSAVILLSSVKDNELMSVTLTEEDVIGRLFGAVGVRLLESHAFSVGCRCSRDRSAKILASFPLDEVQSMVVDGKVSMTCEFCEIDFDFTAEDLGALERQYAQPPA